MNNDLPGMGVNTLEPQKKLESNLFIRNDFSYPTSIGSAPHTDRVSKGVNRKVKLESFNNSQKFETSPSPRERINA